MHQIPNSKRKYKKQLEDKVERKKQRQKYKTNHKRVFKKKDTSDKFDLEMHLQQFRDAYNSWYDDTLKEIEKAITKDEKVYIKTIGYMVGINPNHYNSDFYCDMAMINIVHELTEKGYKATYNYYSDKEKVYDSDGYNFRNYKQLRVYL